MTKQVTTKTSGYLDLRDLLKGQEAERQPYRSQWSLKPLLESNTKLSANERKWLEGLEDQLQTIGSDPGLQGPPLTPEASEKLLRQFFPPYKKSLQLGAIMRPLSSTEALVTKDYYDLLQEANLSLPSESYRHSLTVQAGMLILNQHYGQLLEEASDIILDHHDGKTGLIAHLRVMSGYDHIEVLVEDKKPVLAQRDIRRLLGNPTDPELWEKTLPPSVFSFRGIGIHHLLDATRDVSQGRLQRLLLKREAVLSERRLIQMQDVLRNYLRVPDLRMGIMALDYPRVQSASHRYLIRQDFLSKEVDDILAEQYGDTIYVETCKHGSVRIYDDLRDCKDDNGPLDELLLQNGIMSLVLVPLFGRGDNVIGMLELGSAKPYAFNNLVLYHLESIAPLFRQAIRRSRDDMEARIQAVMRTNFTALDPSIEWRFVQAASEIIEREQSDDTNLPPTSQIRFEDVYALYAQADIVGSSKIRNEAIQADLLAELDAAQELLESPAVKLRFPMAGKLIYDIKELRVQLGEAMSPNDEQHVIDFMMFNLKPMLDQLQESKELEERVANYRNQIGRSRENGLSQRDAYERSVRRVTSVVNHVISSAQIEAQRIVPHYFSKYRTDGVEFNIYAGQSLLQSGTFSEIHLQNLRLWQLQTMVDVTKAIAGIRDKLATPMSTAQLIFAFGSTITIQFRMDEKRFDVEGAYNVRYEVIKKRIDKALVRGTEERLTQANHVAIVYSHHSDRQIYSELIEYLHGIGTVEGELEDLELEPMQGVDGLHALRVRVL